MGAQLQNVGGRLGKDKPGRRRRSRRGLMSEINVTPFVDVMLVLLIIFMVTAPLMTVGVQVDLPEADAPPLLGEDEPLVVSIKKNGDLYIEKTKIPLDELGPKLQAITKRKTDARIFVHADNAAPYGTVLKTMAAMNNAGFLKVGLVADPLEQK